MRLYVFILRLRVHQEYAGHFLWWFRGGSPGEELEYEWMDRWIEADWVLWGSFPMVCIRLEFRNVFEVGKRAPKVFTACNPSTKRRWSCKLGNSLPMEGKTSGFKNFGEELRLVGACMKSCCAPLCFSYPCWYILCSEWCPWSNKRCLSSFAW